MCLIANTIKKQESLRENEKAI